MVHSELALPVGYILNLEGRKIGFSGDTCWHEGIIDFLAKSDKVILECNFVEKIGEGHISVDELESSREIQKRKTDVYLTHLYEGSSQKAKELGYNTFADGDVLNFET